MKKRNWKSYLREILKASRQKVLNFIDDKKKLYNSILEYVDGNEEEDFEQLSKILGESQIRINTNELKSLLQIISSIVNNHYRQIDFFKKIERILLQIISIIKHSINAKNLIKIFQHSKIMILFFIENQILSVEDLPQTTDFLAYFYPEFDAFFQKEEQKQKCLEALKKFSIEYDKESFIKNRKKGENNLYICSLIRTDSIEEFISYVNRNNLSLSTEIPQSIFESHLYLINNTCNLIEYSAFFGSIQIFNYLRMNNVILTPSLWFCSIHGKNAEMIHLLEENNVGFDTRDYDKLNPKMRITKDRINLNFLANFLSESIKCSHNDIAYYIKEKMLEFAGINYEDSEYVDNYILLKHEIQDKYVARYDKYYRIDENDYDVGDLIADSIFQSYNYFCFPIDIKKDKYILFLCQYDYFELFKLLVNSNHYLLSKNIILKIIFVLIRFLFS